MNRLFVITEQDRKHIYHLYKINEQRSDFAMDRQGNALSNVVGVRSDSDYKKVNKIIKTAEDEAKFTVNDPHTLLMVAQIATAFIPVVGIFISAGLGFADAALYYNEGDKKTAGMTAMFSVIPLLGPVVSKIPAINKLGSKGMKILSDKIAKGGNNAKYTSDEISVINSISKEKSLITQELNNYSKNIATQGVKQNMNPATKQILKSIAKGGLKFGAVTGGYVGAGVAYNKIYDAINPLENNQMSSLDILNAKPTQSHIDAAKSIKWD